MGPRARSRWGPTRLFEVLRRPLRRRSVRRSRDTTVWWAVTGMAIVAMGVVVIWWLPTLLTRHPEVPDPAERHKAAADVRTGLVAFLALVGAGIGVVYTSWTFRLTRTGQITDRYSKAVDQLGSATPEVCVGGIYAFHQIMRDSPHDIKAISEVLCIFVRSVAKRTKDGSAPWPPDEAERDEMKPSFKVQAALDVLAPLGVDGLDLRDSDLRGARLQGALFRAANLRRSNLAKAHLQDADLEGAQLVDACLEGARLHGTRLERVNLYHAQITKGTITPEALRSRGAENVGGVSWTDPPPPTQP